MPRRSRGTRRTNRKNLRKSMRKGVKRRIKRNTMKRKVKRKTMKRRNTYRKVRMKRKSMKRRNTKRKVGGAAKLHALAAPAPAPAAAADEAGGTVWGSYNQRKDQEALAQLDKYFTEWPAAAAYYAALQKQQQKQQRAPDRVAQERKADAAAPAPLAAASPTALDVIARREQLRAEANKRAELGLLLGEEEEEEEEDDKGVYADSAEWSKAPDALPHRTTPPAFVNRPRVSRHRGL